MSFFAIMLIFFAVRRLGFGGFGMRHWRGHRGYRHRYMDVPCPPGTTFKSAPAEPARLAESTFDVLKKRYVRGELSDEQYESKLDDLLKTPEGRGMVG